MFSVGLLNSGRPANGTQKILQRFIHLIEACVRFSSLLFRGGRNDLLSQPYNGRGYDLSGQLENIERVCALAARQVAALIPISSAAIGSQNVAGSADLPDKVHRFTEDLDMWSFGRGFEFINLDDPLADFIEGPPYLRAEYCRFDGIHFTCKCYRAAGTDIADSLAEKVRLDTWKSE